MYHLAPRHLKDRPLAKLTDDELQALERLYAVAVTLDSPLVQGAAGDLGELARREAADRDFQQNMDEQAGWPDDVIDAALQILAGHLDGRYAAVALTSDGVRVAKNTYASRSQAQAPRLAGASGNAYVVTISAGAAYLMHRADGVDLHIRSRRLGPGSAA